MKEELLEVLRCPKTGEKLKLHQASVKLGEVESGILMSEQSRNQYAIVNYLPRFVDGNNYADNFGFQWNYFSKTLLDSHSGYPISSARFWQATGWNPTEMKDKWVLDIGCGSGRFAEIALESGCKLLALDYSIAVNSCYDNLKHFPNLHIVQGNIYELPFQKEQFSFIYSLGVLQHTPDVKKAFFCILPFLNSGGKVCVDFYEKTWKAYLLPKFWLRFITPYLPQSFLFEVVRRFSPLLFEISEILRKIPVIGNLLKRLIPVANYSGILKIPKKMLIEFAILDTFDWLSPKYDNPQTAKTVSKWFREANLKDIKIHRVAHLVGSGEK